MAGKLDRADLLATSSRAQRRLNIYAVQSRAAKDMSHSIKHSRPQLDNLRREC